MTPRVLANSQPSLEALGYDEQGVAKGFHVLAALLTGTFRLYHAPVALHRCSSSGRELVR